MASTTFQPMGKDKGLDKSLEKARDEGKDLMNKTKEAGAEVLDKAKEAGTDVLGKAREAAAAVGDVATETATAVGRKADDLTATAGHQIREFGDNLSQRGPHEGFTGAASQAVADTIKGSGRYIEEHKLSGMAQDVEGMIRNHPIPALLLCFGLGFCIGRVMKD